MKGYCVNQTHRILDQFLLFIFLLEYFLKCIQILNCCNHWINNNRNLFDQNRIWNLKPKNCLGQVFQFQKELSKYLIFQNFCFQIVKKFSGLSVINLNFKITFLTSHLQGYWFLEPNLFLGFIQVHCSIHLRYDFLLSFQAIYFIGRLSEIQYKKTYTI